MNRKEVFKNFEFSESEKGFSLIEVIMAVALSMLIMGLAVQVFTSQRKVVSKQSELARLQGNSRASMEYIARVIKNTGYNITRGTRFLSASDNSITSVFDEDNDNVIQNDEVSTFIISNATGSTTSTFKINPYFDMNDDGDVANSETREYTIANIHSGPTYNLYKVVLNKSNNGYERHKVAQNIDNLILRYYDKDDAPLPAGVTVVDGKPVPPYVLSASDMNEIRRVEIEIMGRSKNPDLRPNFVSSGTYPTGSVATLGGASTYSDTYNRETYSVNTAPRNLVMSPWGKVNIVANPDKVECPSDNTTITASLTNADGAAVSSGLSVAFVASDGTLSADTDDTDGDGNAVTTLTYDWTAPNKTITMSASALIDIGGETFPIFNAVPVDFASGSGVLTDNFQDGDSDGWDEEGETWEVIGEEFKTESAGIGLALNGCSPWQDYVMQADLKRSGALGPGEFIGVILRYKDSDEYYKVQIICPLGTSCVNDYKLQIVDFDSGDTVLEEHDVTMADTTFYTLKARIEGTNIKVKFWQSSGAEPGTWLTPAGVDDNSYTSGEIGLITTLSEPVFDNITVNPPT